MDKLIQQLYAVALAVNALVTAIVFFPWVLPRETFSGFIGRKADVDKNPLARLVAPLVNRLCFWEENHCWFTAWQEFKARRCFRE